jgi:putative RNA 2'-phosphotransferase
MDQHGWVLIEDLLPAANRAGVPLTYPILLEVVAQNDKQRFAIRADGRAIRARQGHSIPVDLEFVPRQPPPQLYHGTAEGFLPSIRAQGLTARSRQYVHLSADPQTATAVGKRHGIPVVLTVHSDAMHQDGYSFYLSENGVWLVESVPAAYLAFPDREAA